MKSWRRFFIALLSIGTIATVAAVVLGVYVVFWTGLRATAEPSAFEATIARTVRNWAIPGRERREKNPLQATADNIQAGRDEFLTQCAGCHGHDGSGLTPMGRNLYPRAPNLRSAMTQALTDGEMRYIIENGVPLSGMAARGNPHKAEDAWRLVSFIRSLRPLPGEEDKSRDVKVASSAHYVGSQACEACHADEYRRWKKTPMANVVRVPDQSPPTLFPDLTTNTVFPFKPQQVAFVYGSLWKQRYFTKVGDDYFPLPVQWEVGTKKWSKYFVAADWWASFYPPDNMQRPTGPTCDGCHSVGYDIHTKQVAEWNVGCERCHGPGSDHVTSKSRDSIVNPARMADVAANDTCIQCHSQGRPRTIPLEGKYYDWPVGYDVGLRLADYWTLEERKLGATDFYYFADGTAHKNRMQGNDFSQSLMYRRGITCFDCHDVHGTGNYAQLIKPANTLCMDCHGPSSPNGPHADEHRKAHAPQSRQPGEPVRGVPHAGD